MGLSDESKPVDLDSLSILERAIGLYRSTDGVWDKTGEEHPHLEDFADLDVHLMRDSLEKYGLLNESGSECFRGPGSRVPLGRRIPKGGEKSDRAEQG